MKRVHCKQEHFDVLIDRTTIWGNPFVIGVDGTRSEVIEKYHQYIINNETLMSLLYTLDGKILGCWCKQEERCHADVLIHLTTKMKNDRMIRNIFK
jgi:hypothetical protein